MTKTLILLLFLFMLLSPLGEASAPKISYWASTYYSSADFSNFIALSGHTNDAGDSNDNGANVSIMPAATLTNLAAVTNDPAVPGRANIITVYKNGLATAASCTVPNGSLSCSWTGSVSFADGDLANIRLEESGGILIKGPWSVMTVFTLGGRDWPFTA